MQIDVWSDYACPWCALGLARLQVALADFEHAGRGDRGAPRVRVGPACAGADEGTQEERLRRKYGMSPEQVRAGHAHLTALGAEVGFTFDFEHVRSGSTFDAHRLTQAARGTRTRGRTGAAAVRRPLQRGPAALGSRRPAGRGRRGGRPADVTEKVLGGDAYAEEVRADEAAAEELEVTGVPFFLIGGAWPVPGAQDVETLGLLLRRAWSRIGH